MGWPIPLDFVRLTDDECRGDAILLGGLHVITLHGTVGIGGEPILTRHFAQRSAVLLAFQKSLDRLERFVADAYHGDVVAVANLKVAQVGNARDAGAAPRSPKFQDVNLVVFECLDWLLLVEPMLDVDRRCLRADPERFCRDG
jgi:hypothetical protein